MKPIQILGAVIFIGGLVVLGFANHASNAPLDQLSDTLTGRFSDRTMWSFVFGATATAGGALLAFFGKWI